jgi:CheY-like chemotaxis protein
MMRPRHSILIVDDDPSFRELYRMALRLEGFKVMTASNGVEALRVLEQETPSVVVLDINMPCLDGWSVLRELRAHPATRATPVIIVTGTDVHRATERAAAILNKPVMPDQVLPVIRRELYAA